MTLWYVSGDVAYYHLAAYSDRGYDLGASFALFWTALKYFAAIGIRWAAIGAGPGTTAAESGLTRFKRGWSTGTRSAHFCGRILQPTAYAELSANAAAGSSYFPAYRRA
jgi:lipid II:glycine glycyltransferase (peptidoglycan interpeptide bridge formation enzyme)